MPELAEVETIRLQLEKSILNQKVKRVIVYDKRIIKDIKENDFKRHIEGKRIIKIFRRGKILIVKINEGFLVFHLRISGWLLLSEKEEKFSRVIFELSNNKKLNFCDSRILGEIRFVKDWHTLSIIKTMGPEPLEITKEEFAKLFQGKKTKIKPLLMDQSFIAGVGNVYAQESLFCGGIHPERRADTLSNNELEKFYNCLVSILKQAIKKGGSSVDTYRQIDGKEGEYTPFLKVYQREGKPCYRCKATIKRKVIGGRSTYFCLRCQK